MGSRAIGTAALAAAVAALNATPASATAQSFCDELGGRLDGAYCHTAVTSVRNADRDIRVALPGDLIDNPTTGPVIRPYLDDLYRNWRAKAADMVQDSFAEANFEVHRRGPTLSLVFRESYHADGPEFNNAYRTFTFDMANGKQLSLADIVMPGLDPLKVLPPLAQPFIAEALDLAPPPHQPGTYPFTADRWTPDNVYSGAYRAWALTPDTLIIYMPDYPAAHDVPINYSPGMPVWSMDGGTVQARIPLNALASALRPEYGG